MATTSFSLERALDGLEQDGFVDLKDESIGEHVLQLEQRRFPFSSKYGLDFCDSYVLQDKVSQSERHASIILTIPSVSGLSSNRSFHDVSSPTG